MDRTKEAHSRWTSLGAFDEKDALPSETLRGKRYGCCSTDIIAPSTPQFKQGATFLYEPIDQYRPEVLSYHDTVRRFKTKRKILCISADSTRKPAYLTPEQEELEKSFDDPNKVQFCRYSRHLGLIPLEISDLYPASHYVETYDADPTFTYLEFAKTWEKFFLNNSFDLVYYSDDKFLTHYIRRLPKGVRKRRL